MASVAMRSALVRLGCSNEAATAIVDDQGIDDLDELRVLKDDEIGNLCKVVRRPGGTMNDGNGNPIPATGNPVSFRAENNIKLAAYWLRHQVRVSRETATADITLASVRSTRHLRDLEAQRGDDEPKEPTIDPKDWPKTIEAIEEYFRSSYGITNIPLAYVIRQRADLPEGADPVGNYINK